MMDDNHHVLALLLEKLEQMHQLQAQSTSHFEDLRKSYDDYQRRTAATIESLERRIKTLEEHLPQEKLPPIKKIEKRTRPLTAEQTKYKREICQVHKEYTTALPPMEVRKVLSKKLFDQFKDDPHSPLSMEVCESQINHWFYDQMRNKSRPSPGTAVGEKKRSGRKRKVEGQGWASGASPPTPSTAAQHDAADLTPADESSSELPQHHSAAASALPPAAAPAVVTTKEHMPHVREHSHHHHHHHHHPHHSHTISHDDHPPYEPTFSFSE